MLKETAFKIGVSVSACPMPNAKCQALLSVYYGSHASKAKWYGHFLNLHGSAFPAFSLSDFHYYMFQILLRNSMLQCLFSFYSLCPYHAILLSFSMWGIVLVKGS